MDDTTIKTTAKSKCTNVHELVEFVSSQHGVTIFVCRGCNKEFQEYEESHGG